MVAKTHPDRGTNPLADTSEILECQVCSEPVDRQRDYFGCDTIRARHALTGEEYPASWAPLHIDCRGASSFYCIDLADLTSPIRVLWWTAHLNTKSWNKATDWIDFVAKVGGYF